MNEIMVPSEFIKESRAPHSTRLVLHIFLKKRNVDQMEKLFWDVSNPKSQHYGKYLTADEIGQRHGASKESIDTVRKWLMDGGVSHHEVPLTKDLVRVEATANVVETLFGTTLSTFSHKHTGKKVISASGVFSVPQYIRDHIQHISGLDHFSSFYNSMGSKPTSLQANLQAQNSLTLANTPLSFFAILPYINPNTLTFSSITLKIIVAITCNNINADPIFPYCGSIQNVVIQSSFTGQTTPPNQIPIPSNQFLLRNTSGNYNIYVANTTLSTINYLPYNISTFFTFTNGTTGSVIYAPVLYYTNKFTTPNNIASYYGTNFRRSTNPRNIQAFAGFGGQYFSQNDLNMFFDNFNLPRYNISKVNGFNDQSNPGDEASLDSQYITGIGLNVSTQFWSVSENIFGEQDGLSDYMYKISNTSDSEIPYVHSFSYAGHEEYIYNDITLSYAQNINEEFIKAGLRGITLLFAAGDGGVGTRLAYSSPSFCENYSPTFPASSPYVTAVGATQWSTSYTTWCDQTNSCQQVKEIVSMSDRGGGITSGGGFSTFFPMPDYQKAVVNSYLNNPISNLPPSSCFNSSGRAYPDISVVGSNYIIFYNGVPMPVSGTSASTPVFAAMVSLLNDVRLNAGNPPLGFINPLLYQLYEQDPSYFNDIVVGNNRCSQQSISYLGVFYCCPNGFNAAPGYDSVSGLGSPRFDKLYSYIQTQYFINQGNNLSISFFAYLLTGLIIIWSII
jgi:tripeptidyl-peptidase-1